MPGLPGLEIAFAVSRELRGRTPSRAIVRQFLAHLVAMRVDAIDME